MCQPDKHESLNGEQMFLLVHSKTVLQSWPGLFGRKRRLFTWRITPTFRSAPQNSGYPQTANRRWMRAWPSSRKSGHAGAITRRPA